jgi:hypothetical protein
LGSLEAGMKEEIEYINPYRLKKEDLPLIVLSDLSSGFVEWAIKWRTNASYNHIMMMIWPGEFQSQGNVYSSVGIDRYMKKNSRLKFWRIKDLTENEGTAIKGRVINRLNLPWHKRLYDYVGILWQLTGLRWINNPLKAYCSEQVANDLKGIIELGKHPSPKDIDEAFKKHPRMKEYGRWEAT